jgi:hypothetical protein
MEKVVDRLSEKVDVFGLSPSLNVAGKGTYSTKIGALMSLVSLGLSLAYGISCAARLFFKRDPTITYLTEGLNLIGS